MTELNGILFVLLFNKFEIHLKYCIFLRYVLIKLFLTKIIIFYSSSLVFPQNLFLFF